jgi:hypothetical protein
MKLDDPVQTLQRLHNAAEWISANLVELEIDSTRRLLESSKLEGESAVRWSAASDATTELWRRHALLEDLLQRIDRLHGSRRADELRSLLEAPSIELANSDVPLAERTLLGTPRVADRCSPDELLCSMSAAFDEIKTVVSTIGGAWEALVPKLDAARRLHQGASQLAAQLGETGGRDLDSASDTLDRLSASIRTDPLSVAPDAVDGLVRALHAVRDDLEGISALKRGFAAAILEARALLERLRTAIREAQAAHEELLIKVSVRGTPAAPKARGELETELTGIEALAQTGAWREARRALADWTARSNELLDDARRALDANRAPIDARNQFRALLEAYQVKAKRLRLVEDPQLEDIFARAREALWNAPTDLALAAQLVRSYQQALTGSPPSPEAMP